MINLVIDILKANTTLTNLVDADNIYPLIQLQGGSIPAVVVQLTNTDPNDTQDKVSTYDNNSVEVTCMAISPAAAWGISEAVRAALDGYTGGSLAQIRFQTQATDIFESTEVFSVTQGYSVHLKRDGATLPTAIQGLGAFEQTLEEHTNVTIDGPIDRQALVYDEATSEWINDGVGQVVIPVRNSDERTALTIGQVVKAVGAQGDRILVSLFDPATDDTKLLVGVISEQIAGGADGHAQVYGELRKINTDDFEVGDVLYPQSDGSLDTTENEYPIGFVTRKQQNTGRLFIRLWAPGRGYHQRYRTEAAAEMFVGVGATVELYYTATADGDGYVTQDLTAAVADGNVEERVLRYKSGAFGDSGTTIGWTDAGLATDATYAEMLTAFNNLLKTESPPISVYATRAEVAARTGLLDDYPGAAAAYSLRLLDGDYSGSAIRVRRASDNAEQDIGFDANGDLDTTALATFCSGTNGFVKVWYDQSGNSNDAEQTSTGSQPKIYDGTGGVITDGGLPVVDCDYTAGTSLSVTSPSGFDSMDNFTLLMAANFTLFEDFDYNFTLVDTNGLDIILRNQDPTTFRVAAFSPGSGAIIVSSSTGRHLVFAGYGANAQVAVDGVSTSGTINISSYGTSDALYINRVAAGLEAKAKYYEVICYPSDQSTNRSGIETNINDYYSIYTP